MRNGFSGGAPVSTHDSPITGKECIPCWQGAPWSGDSGGRDGSTLEWEKWSTIAGCCDNSLAFLKTALINCNAFIVLIAYGSGLHVNLPQRLSPPVLWLQRHAQPLVAPGVCYGRSNLAADDNATTAAAVALQQAWRAEGLEPGEVWHSPLQRCEHLALNLQAIEPVFTLKPNPDLAEMDFGNWEGLRWDAIARAEMNAWTADFWNHAPGGGESLAAMMARVNRALTAARSQSQATGQPVLWLTHAGVAQCAHWLITRGERQPTAKDWPSVKLAYGEWIRLPLR